MLLAAAAALEQYKAKDARARPPRKSAPAKKPPPKKPPPKNPDKDKAIATYKEKVKAKGVAWSGGEAAAPPSVAVALACLQQTTPKLALKYPSDAEAHF